MRRGAKRGPRLSGWFHDQLAGYEAELDDLATDSEGRNVLQRRLQEKRREFDTLVGLAGEFPALAAPALHGAFRFEAAPLERLEALLEREPGDFPSWGELGSAVAIADWAHPLIERALQEASGEDFLATVLGLEFARSRALRGGAAALLPDDAGTGVGGDRDGGDESGGAGEAAEGVGRGQRGDDYDEDDDGRDIEDDETLGEDYLEDQGFDRRNEP